MDCAVDVIRGCLRSADEALLKAFFAKVPKSRRYLAHPSTNSNSLYRGLTILNGSALYLIHLSL